MNQSTLKSKLKVMRIVVAIVLVFALASCGGGSGNNTGSGSTGNTVTSVELDNSTLNLEVGGEKSLSFFVLPEGATYDSARWASSNNAVVTVTASGNNTATVRGVAAGTANVRVTVGGKSAICNVTVTDSSTMRVEVSEVNLSKQAITLAGVGETETLTAEVLPANATDKTVTWKSTQQSVATVDQTGLVTAVAAGKAIIQATAGKITASCLVTVNGSSTDTPVEELYVEKIQTLVNRETPFIMAMDASAVPSIERARATQNLYYLDFDGQQRDVFEILKDNGITHIRIRIWNDPYADADKTQPYGGGNCDLENALEICERCEKIGLGVIIDFHYSDFWADPGKQTRPKAWANFDTDQVKNAIYTFTKDSLTEIKATGVDIAMVQIGNETTAMFCGASYEDQPDIYCDYMNQGARAVREVTGTVAGGGAKVAVHFTNPESGGYYGFANTLTQHHVDYDVFGTSYYPFWHGTLENLSDQLSIVHNATGKEVMCLETSYANTRSDADGYGNTQITTVTEPLTPQGQVNAVSKVIKTIANLGEWGLGISYWEGTWIAASTSRSSSYNVALCKEYGCGWATSYAHGYDSSANDGGCVIDNQAFWNSDGTPIPSLKVFKGVYTGADVKVTVDEAEAQYLYYTVNVGPIVLPSTAHVIMNDGSSMTASVVWEATDKDLEDYIANVGEYEIHGTTPYGGDCIVYVYVSNPNLLKDYSFEESTGYGAQTESLIQQPSSKAWTFESRIDGTSELQLYVSSESQNAKPGANSFHFWDNGNVNFVLYQEITAAELETYGPGTYTACFDVQGDAGINVDIHAYVTITNKDGSSRTVSGTKIGFEGWQNFVRASVDVELDENVQSVIVGISVYAEATGDGPWGNIDNCQFYFVEPKE